LLVFATKFAATISLDEKLSTSIFPWAASARAALPNSAPEQIQSFATESETDLLDQERVSDVASPTSRGDEMKLDPNTSLKDEDRPPRGPEIRLLDEPKLPLERHQAPLVVGEVHFWVFGNLREPRAARDDEALRFNCAIR